MAFDLSCITLNVRGLNNIRKRRQVFRWLHGRKFQVIFLQEIIVRGIQRKFGLPSGEEKSFTALEQNIAAVL